MAATGLARVYLEMADGTLEGGPDTAPAQHLAAPSEDATAVAWDGTTSCGVAGRLRYVTPENVDRAHQCPGCTAAVGTSPPLDGDWPGPV